MKQTGLKLLAALLCALFAVGPAAARDWSRTVTRSAVGAHVLGNPAAPHRLITYVSYTCPHCAHFEEESMQPLRTTYIAKGQLAVEVRNLLRDPLDVTAALLARCGGTARFFGNHAAFMASQRSWIEKAQGSSEAVQKSWYEGSIAERSGRVAAALGFDKLMSKRGVAPAAQKACLADAKSLSMMKAMTEKGLAGGVRGTPAFMLDGVLLDGVSSWTALKPRLDALWKRS